MSFAPFCFSSNQQHNALGQPIQVQRGTRQGGLSSTFIFNTVYQHIIRTLNNMTCGVTIDGTNFNTICYADDILLCSTTHTGLQCLIDKAADCISDSGLRFNPSKTKCMTFGRHSFVEEPSWTLGDQSLSTVDSITYLGVELSMRPRHHITNRIRSAQRAFYGLQGAGLHFQGLAPRTSSTIYQTGVLSVLTYGCHSIALRKTDLTNLERNHAKFIKTMLGLPTYCHNTPLLQALGINRMEHIIQAASLDLLRTSLVSNSATSKCYSFLLGCNSSYTKNTLVGRVRNYCGQNNINVNRYNFNDNYRTLVRKQLKSHVKDGVNGHIDSIRTCLLNYDWQNRNIVHHLVKPF